MAEETGNLTLHNIIQLLLMRWRLLMVAAVLFAIGTLIYAHYLPLKYTGTTIFERRQDPAADQTSYQGSESFEARKLTLKHELAGLGATTEAIEKLGLTRGLPRDSNGQLTLAGQQAKNKLVEQMMEKVSIQWEVSSRQVDLVSVSFTDSDPWLAEHMPNTLVENYINRVSENAVERLSESRNFLENQVKICDNRFSELMKQRIDFEVKNAGVLPDSPAALNEGIVHLNTDIDTLRFQHAMAEQELARLEGLGPVGINSADDPNLTKAKPLQVHYGTNPEYTRLKDEIQKTKDLLTAVLDVKNEKHPDVEMLRQKIARLEQQLEQTPPEAILQTVYGTNRENTDLAIQVLAKQSVAEMTEKELERLQNRLDSHQNLLANFGPVRREYLEIVKKIEDQQAELAQWEGRLRDVHMALAAEVAKRRTHLNAVQPALKQFYPSSPIFWRVLAFAVVGGLAFGVGMIIIAGRLDRSIMTPEQASHSFDFPVFGYVDVILMPRQLFLQRIRRWILTPLISLLLAAALSVFCFSLFLRLDSPERYKQWREAPLKYLSGQAGQVVGKNIGTDQQ